MTEWQGELLNNDREPRLSCDSIAKVRDALCRDDADDLEIGGLDREVIEEADPLAKKQRHEVDVDLVDEPSIERLLEDGRRADLDVLLAGSLPRLADGALDAIGDEDERRSLMRPIIGDGVCQHEAG